MPTSIEFAEKIRYVIQSLDRTRHLTSLLDNDLQKRSVGKSAFVLVESGILFLRRLNNSAALSTTRSPDAVKKLINSVENDYKNFILLRNKMHSHRQKVPTLDALRAWRIMHDDYLLHFRDVFFEIYSRISAYGQAIPKIRNANPLAERIQKRLKKASITSHLYFSASSQGFFSGAGLGVVPGGPPFRGADVLDTFDVLNLCQTISKAVKGVDEYSRLTAVLYLVEAIAMFDTLYDDQNPLTNLREQSFLDELVAIEKTPNSSSEKIRFSIHALNNAKQQIDAQGVRDRTLRNRIAAHIDPRIPMSQLVAEMRQYDWAALCNAVQFSQDTFRTACESGPLFLRVFARHGYPLLGLDSILHSDPPPAYD